MHILTIAQPINFSQNGRLEVYRLRPGPMESFLQHLKKTLTVESPDNAIKRKRALFRLGKLMLETVKKTYGLILAGDYKTEWFPVFISNMNKLGLKEYKVLITSQYPLVDGLIGLYIKSRYPDIFWIADIGDPVCAPYNAKLKKPIDEYFEKKIVHKADRVIVTNRNIRLLLSCKYGVSRKKIEIITQGFDAERFKNKKLERVKNENFTMFFSGTFYRGFREPKNLIDALCQLKHLDFKLKIAGRNELFLKDFDKIKNKVEFLGFVPYEKSLELQENADVLVNISNKQVFQVPGKLFEYIGSKKPILNIVYDKDRDETAWFINRFRIGLVCENRVEEIKNDILTLYKEWENNKLYKMFKFDNTDLLEFSWQNGAEKLKRIVSEGLFGKRDSHRR